MDGECQNEQHERVLMGVCVELARRMDIHPLLVRVNMVLAGLLVAPLVIAAYLLAGLLLGKRKAVC
jgi:phage shock protein PspC (stress-responsive transcriptional regulator)